MRHRNLNRPHKQKGVALITAVLVVALVTVLAVNMISRQQIDIRRTGNILNTETAYMYALGIESWGIGILLRDRENNKVDALGEDWAMTIPPIDVDGGQIVGRIEDAQSRFNLNNLLKTDKDGKEELSVPDYNIFKRLLGALSLNVTIADEVVDWIDKNKDVYNSGAEDYDYLGANPAYRTANTKMVSHSELRLVSGIGIDPDAYKILEPFVTALPTRTPININTALAPVIQALGDNIEQTAAEDFVDLRSDDGLSIDDFKNEMGTNKIDTEAELSVKSEYFILFGESRFGRGRQLLTTLVHRPADTGKATVIMRGQGAY